MCEAFPSYNTIDSFYALHSYAVDFFARNLLYTFLFPDPIGFPKSAKSVAANRELYVRVRKIEIYKNFTSPDIFRDVLGLSVSTFCRYTKRLIIKR